MHPFTKAIYDRMSDYAGSADPRSVNDAIALGLNPVVISAGALPAAALTNAVAIGDLFMGDQNGINSGELPMNSIVGAVPALGGLAGGMLGATGAYYGAPETAAPQRVVDLNSKDNYKSAPVSPKRNISRGRMASRAGIGAAIGSAVAAIPAIGYMANDTTDMGALAASLSPQDRQVLNSLLANQGANI